MWLTGKRALVTGSSRGIGRGIALKLAEQGARVGITYVQNEAAAWETLREVRALGSDGFARQAGVGGRPDVIAGLTEIVQEELGGLDILVSNARGEPSTFSQPPLALGLEQWNAA